MNPMEVLARAAEHVEQQREAELAALLQRLESQDGEVVHKALEIWDGDRREVAIWFAVDHLELDDISPYRALALGKRQEVLDILNRLFYGFVA